MNKDEYILGINGLGVTPSACLLKNGQLVAMTEEERFNRIKGSFGLMPVEAIKYCLAEENIDASHLQSIEFAWDCTYYTFKMPLFLLKQLFKRAPIKQDKQNFVKVLNELLKYQPWNVKRLIKKAFKQAHISGRLPKIGFIEHHQAHAASSFFCSGFKESYILVIDGSGENKTTSIWKGTDKSLHKIKEFKIPDSLGWFYQSITEYLGYTPNSHEGKTMALAAYGEKDAQIEMAFNDIIQFDKDGNYHFNPKYAFAGKHSKGQVFSDELEELLGPARSKHQSIEQHHKNIALAAQITLEKIVLALCQNILAFPDFNGNLCIAGGVGLNCKMNGSIAQLKGIKALYVPPFSNDAGTSLGAAQLVSKRLNPSRLEHAYWGPEFSNEEIEKVLLSNQIKYTKEIDISAAVAQLLHEGKIAAWFQGRLEIGSRALGARSIVANPSLPSTRDFINKNIKNREVWRPFAAAFSEEKCEEYISKNLSNPFMTMACKVHATNAHKISAAIHIDQTTRPQLVSKASNPKFWRLIHHFGELSGTYAVLNTSFNLSEEPIVCTPDQAIRSFERSELDALAIGDFLIRKE